MKTITEIILQYNDGTKDLVQTNEELEKVLANIRLDPNKNVIQDGEEEEYGLLDVGIGKPDKVRVKNMELVDNDMGNTYATCLYMGKKYRVIGKKLVDPKEVK